jgi:hypothetical protein
VSERSPVVQLVGEGDGLEVAVARGWAVAGAELVASVERGSGLGVAEREQDLADLLGVAFRRVACLLECQSEELDGLTPCEAAHRLYPVAIEPGTGVRIVSSRQ